MMPGHLTAIIELLGKGVVIDRNDKPATKLRTTTSIGSRASTC
jgi:hypothetical protein